MNKTELIERIAKDADLSKVDATRAMESFMGTIKRALSKGDSVALLGFGTFRVTRRAARVGRNPRNGAAIKIKAKNAVIFSSGKGLRSAVN